MSMNFNINNGLFSQLTNTQNIVAANNTVESKLFPVDTLSNPFGGLTTDNFGNIALKTDINNLTSKELGIIFKAQMGAYDKVNTYTSQNPYNAAKLADITKQSGAKDAGDLVLAPMLQETRETTIGVGVDKNGNLKQVSLYDYAKEATKGKTSKEILQMSLDPNLDPQLKAALYLRAQVKKDLQKTAKGNFERMKAAMAEDPATDKARKEAEESAKRANRAAYGLDDKE